VKTFSHRPFLGLLALGTLAMVTSLRASAQNPPSRYQATEVEVKAAFLYHFAQLVTWPPPSQTFDPSTPLVIAVIGPDPFGDRLEATIGEGSVRGRPIRILRLSSISDLSEPPNILFVGPGNRIECARVLAAVAKSPVLTVSSTRGFARWGGMIEFRITPDGRVAFDINSQAVAAAGLKMSSQLLKIAQIVETTK
jgi:hypothetical protein